MADYRRFTKTDWECYSGAEAFSDGSNPFIYNRPMNAGLAGLEIILDKQGIEVHLYSNDSNEDNVWTKEVENLTVLRAEGYMRKLIEYTLKFDYAPDLAYALDHPDDKVIEGFEFC